MTSCGALAEQNDSLGSVLTLCDLQKITCGCILFLYLCNLEQIVSKNRMGERISLSANTLCWQVLSGTFKVGRPHFGSENSHDIWHIWVEGWVCKLLEGCVYTSCVPRCVAMDRLLNWFSHLWMSITLISTLPKLKAEIKYDWLIHST